MACGAVNKQPEKVFFPGDVKQMVLPSAFAQSLEWTETQTLFYQGD